MPRHRSKPVHGGCCDRGDHAISYRRSALPSRPPTELCPVCHNIVGVPSPEGVLESWAILPCGHRFGDHCLKIWLGMSNDATCPVCRVKMVHVCGHPTLPRPAPPLPIEEADISPEEDGSYEKTASNSLAGVQEVQIGRGYDEDVGDNQGNTIVCGGGPKVAPYAGHSRMSPKRAVHAAAMRVRIFRGAAGHARADEAAAANYDAPAQEGRIMDRIGTARPPPREQAAAALSPKGPGRRRTQRRRHRQQRSVSPRPAVGSTIVVASRPAAPRVSSQTRILEMLATRSHTPPANTPLFFQMAYPKDVDLTLPCTYCYLSLCREPEDSPYRGGNGNHGRYGTIFKGSAQEIARSAATIKTAARIAIRFFFKATPPNANNEANNFANNLGNNGVNQNVIHVADNNNVDQNNIIVAVDAGNNDANAAAADNNVAAVDNNVQASNNVVPRQITHPESMLMAAYWDSWRQVNGKDFGEWWAEQEPRTEPAVKAVAEGWNLANMMGY